MTGEQTTFSEVWRGEVSERGKTLKTTNHKQSWPTTEGEALPGGDWGKTVSSAEQRVKTVAYL